MTPTPRPAWLCGPDPAMATELRAAGAEAARFAADLIRIDTTNRGGGDGRERPAAEYVAARLAEAGGGAVLLGSAPGRARAGAGEGGGAGGRAGAGRAGAAGARAPGRGACGPVVVDRSAVRGRDPRRRAVGPRRGGHEERRRGAARGGQPVGALWCAAAPRRGARVYRGRGGHGGV